jgi:hypothetical protein
MAKTDIFISFKNHDELGKKTRDCELAEEVYIHFKNCGLDVFFSNVTLSMLGESNYAKAIDDALDAAKILIAVGTTQENFCAKWVEYEWRSFFNDILSDIKPKGRLFVYMEGISPHDLPRILRQNQTVDKNDNGLKNLHTFVLNALELKHIEFDNTSPKPGQLDIPKSEQECRLCSHYNYDTDNEVLIFHCDAGFFSFQEDDSGQHGNLPKTGSPGKNMPCMGNSFILNISSRWYKNIFS